MSVSSNRLSVADIPSFVDEDFLTKVVEILDRLKAQSELSGHPLLASVLAIAKDEAEDDLRTRTGEFKKGGLLSEADSSVIQMAQRFAFGRQSSEKDAAAQPGHLLSLPGILSAVIPASTFE